MKRKVLVGITLVIIVGTVIVSYLAYSRENNRFFVVSSDYENSSLRRGSLLVTKPIDNLEVGDIIRFRNPTDENQIVTQKIVSMEDLIKTRQGFIIERSAVIDEITVVIPLLGYLFIFPWSLIVLFALLVSLMAFRFYLERF